MLYGSVRNQKIRRIMLFPLALCLYACTNTQHLDAGTPVISARTLNANAASYSGKSVYITGYLNTAGHPWEFGIGDHSRYRDAECLNLGEVDFLIAHRKQFDKKRVTLKGEFRQGEWADAWAACDNGNGIVIDEEDLKARYGSAAGIVSR